MTYQLNDHYIHESSEKIVLLRILKEERERLALRMLAVEMLDQRQFNSTQAGEARLLSTELSFLSRMIISLRINLEERNEPTHQPD
jgi:hypothetical protein